MPRDGPRQDRGERPRRRLVRPLSGLNARVVADYAWLIGGYVVRSVVYGVLVALLAHGLGPAEFGRLSLFLALVLAIGYAAGSWPFLAIPILAAEGARIAAVVRITALVAAATCGAGLVVAAAILAASGGTIVAFVLAAIYALSFVGLQASYLTCQTLERTPLVAGYQVLERMLGLASVLLLLVVAELTLPRAQAVLALSAAVACVLAMLHSGRLVAHHDQGAADVAVGLRDVTAAVGPLAAITVLNYLLQWIDILILSAVGSASDVGVYALAYQGYQLAVAAAALGVLTLMPRFARRAVASEGDASTLLRWESLVTSTRLWSMGVGAIVICAAIAYPIAFGVAYERGLPALCLMLGSCAFLAPYSAVVSALQAVKQARTIARVTAVAVAVTLALDLALIPLWGVMGAAVATAAATTFACVAMPYRVLGARRTAKLIGLGAPSAAVALALAMTRSAPVLVAGALVVVANALWTLRAPHAPRSTGLRAR